MGAWYDYHIESRPGVQGGAPIIRGTRTPVRTVVVLCRVTYPDRPEEVRAALPHLTSQQIEAAMAYYQDHAAEIEAEIARQRTALGRFCQA